MKLQEQIQELKNWQFVVMEWYLRISIKQTKLKNLKKEIEDAKEFVTNATKNKEEFGDKKSLKELEVSNLKKEMEELNIRKQELEEEIKQKQEKKYVNTQDCRLLLTLYRRM